MEYAYRDCTPRQTANWCVIVACLQSLVNVYQCAWSACYADWYSAMIAARSLNRGSWHPLGYALLFHPDSEHALRSRPRRSPLDPAAAGRVGKPPVSVTTRGLWIH